MSLLKALVKTKKSYTSYDYVGMMDNCEGNFRTTLNGIVNNYVYDNETTDYEIAHLIKNYCDYGVAYLQQTAKDLKPMQERKDTMTYMNSILAEIMVNNNIPYFHPEEGYSLVDKVIKDFVENEYEHTSDMVLLVTSYIEEFIKVKKEMEEDEVPTIEGE